MHTYPHKEVGHMVDSIQNRKELVDRVKRNFEALSAEEQRKPTALLDCALRAVDGISKTALRRIVDQIFERGWSGPDTYIGSDINKLTNSIDGFKVVVAAEIIGTIHGAPAWCEKYHITPQGLVAAD